MVVVVDHDDESLVLHKEDHGCHCRLDETTMVVDEDDLDLVERWKV